jgi:plastocyanin
MRKVLIPLSAVLLVAGLAATLASAASEPVNAKNYSFGPKTVTISKGDKVVWRNKAGSHTVTFNNGSFDKSISGDDRVSRKFNNRGTYRYYCRPHKALGMKGKVVVE